MVRVKPFAALRPLPNLASRVASPPYDVVSTAEARRLAAGNPISFLHVSRSEIDLPPDTDPYSEAVYAKARENLRRLVAEGTLVREGVPRMYLYRLVREGRSQTGLVACCHIEDYAASVVRRHEKTRADKEEDRTRHILATGAQTGLVFLIFRDQPEFAQRARGDVNARPLVHFDAPDGVTHTAWPVREPQAYVDLFASMEAVYVADGHHRAASALRAGRQRRAAGGAGEDAECNWFMTALFPASEVRILPYNRLVRDLGGQRPEQLLRRLAALGTLAPARHPVPERPGVFCLYLRRSWHRLELDPDTINAGDPVGSLDAALLQERLLGPLLDVGDPRSDPRLEFVGGARSTEEMARRVDGGEAALAVSLHATNVEQLLRVADAGQVMPPKSTWFEPKLRSGLFVHLIDEAPAGGTAPAETG